MTPTTPLTLVGQIVVNYPAGGWLHPHSALAVRPTPGRAQSYDLFFQFGSQTNFAASTNTGSISSTNISGASGPLLGDSIYMLTLNLAAGRECERTMERRYECLELSLGRNRFATKVLSHSELTFCGGR